MTNAREDGPRGTNDILRTAVGSLTERLPDGWRIQEAKDLAEKPVASGRRLQVDRLLRLTAPDGISATLIVAAKSTMTGRNVADVAAQVKTYVDALAPHAGQQPPEVVGVVAAHYLSPPARRMLAEAGLAYIDATGNIRLSTTRPALFIADHGADRDPWRGRGRPKGNLTGAPAAKVARALVDFDRSWSARSLIKVAGVSAGSAYRVLAFLEEENLVSREKSGRVSVPDWPALLRRWSDDYGFARNSRISRWIAPRGLETLLKRAAKAAPEGYAVTGTIAAEEWAAYAPARAAMIYVRDAEETAGSWGLRPAESGANVLLAEPDIDIPFTRTIKSGRREITVAAPAQVAVDLMTGPGRGPAEAEELLNWMKRRESAWRQQ